MVKLVWTDKAIEDLDDIGHYVAIDSEKYAKIVVKRLFSAVDVLEKHPRIGRTVPEFSNENIRELINGNYRIVYTIKNQVQIDILTIHHSARLLYENLLQE
ncbi:MAG: type II toxin-antitoxin system RelE/ParE family toxin [Bacteroidales bacterium]|jgi:addiction module RelE/StbE family toxin|nr:type II toxin-antitoxin system RelE/ParE family toxin [Bacteroidales bacterium]